MTQFVAVITHGHAQKIVHVLRDTGSTRYCKVDGWYRRYSVGETPPRFPVPAIRQGFEVARNLGTGEYVWLHWRQEAVEG